MKVVCDDDELMLITEKGILIRTRVTEIRETGRNAAGVRLIKLDEGDRLVAMAQDRRRRNREGRAADGDQPSPRPMALPAGRLRIQARWISALDSGRPMATL